MTTEDFQLRLLLALATRNSTRRGFFVDNIGTLIKDWLGPPKITTSDDTPIWDSSVIANKAQRAAAFLDSPIRVDLTKELLGNEVVTELFENRSMVAESIVLVSQRDASYVEVMLTGHEVRFGLVYTVDQVSFPHTPEVEDAIHRAVVTKVTYSRSHSPIRIVNADDDWLTVDCLFYKHMRTDIRHRAIPKSERVNRREFLLTPDEVGKINPTLEGLFGVDWRWVIGDSPIWCTLNGKLTLCNIKGELLDQKPKRGSYYPAPLVRKI